MAVWWIEEKKKGFVEYQWWERVSRVETPCTERIACVDDDVVVVDDIMTQCLFNTSSELVAYLWVSLVVAASLDFLLSASARHAPSSPPPPRRRLSPSVRSMTQFCWRYASEALATRVALDGLSGGGGGGGRRARASGRSFSVRARDVVNWNAKKMEWKREL